jgi:hypothetical protein
MSSPSTTEATPISRTGDSREEVEGPSGLFNDRHDVALRFTGRAPSLRSRRRATLRGSALRTDGMPRVGVLCCAATLLAAGPCHQVAAQVPDSASTCQTQILQGKVAQGESFEARLDGGLVFRLDPNAVGENPQGWTIRVAPETSPDTDHAWVATPPYRFWNSRYLDTSYGVAAAEALARTPREFAFVASSDDYEVAAEALDVLLWPYAHSQLEVDSAGARLSRIPTYAGSLWVEDGSVKPPDAAHPGGVIEWLAFRVQLCVPTGGGIGRVVDGHQGDSD